MRGAYFVRNNRKYSGKLIPCSLISGVFFANLFVRQFGLIYIIFTNHFAPFSEAGKEFIVLTRMIVDTLGESYPWGGKKKAIFLKNRKTGHLFC